MLDYRVYLLDEGGRVGQIPEVIRCANDEDATRRARRLQGHLAAEVWQGARLVIKLDPP
jgi:hypothetical protein